MLGSVLCCSTTTRPKHWILSSLSHGGVLPSSHRRSLFDHDAYPPSRRVSARPRGEGSWNVAWDVRPARWLHRSYSAWLLFGVCAFLATVEFWLAGAADFQDAPPADGEDREVVSAGDSVAVVDAKADNKSADYKVTGVVADGRCLFRAIAHGACLRSGEDAPDENSQRELADQLRARVVEELLKRRTEVERFIEGDFDAYVKRIEQPYVWGGEPELLMASHVLRNMISVFMIDRTSGKLVKIANYGEDYCKDQADPINVLFHGYGHYDILETSHQRYQNVNISLPRLYFDLRGPALKVRAA